EPRRGDVADLLLHVLAEVPLDGRDRLLANFPGQFDHAGILPRGAGAAEPWRGAFFFAGGPSLPAPAARSRRWKVGHSAWVPAGHTAACRKPLARACSRWIVPPVSV